MKIIQKPFGKTSSGERIDLYSITSRDNAEIKVMNYGATITSISIPDNKDRLANIVAGFDRFEDYLSVEYQRARPYFGATIGRYANRINRGTFEIDGHIYHIPCNLGDVAIHGGAGGFDRKVWNVSTKQSGEEATVILSYISPHLEEGFPGNLRVEVRYTWNERHELLIGYTAETDRKTHLNLTNHSYFNLGGFSSDILDHELIIHADHVTEVDDSLLPTGRLKPVHGTCLDFNSPQTIGSRITECNGFDHNYILHGDAGKLRQVASVADRHSGRKMDVLTTEPALQFYTANWLDGTLKRDDVIFDRYSAFCLETQHYPDSPNQPGFPSTLLAPGEKFKSTTIYRFGIDQ